MAMFWNKKIPWLSLSLLALAYGTFGWIYSETISNLTASILDEKEALVNANLFGLLYGLGAILVVVIALSFTAPVTILQLILGDWFRSDKSAVVSVLIWAFVAVIIVSWLAYFVRLLVLLSAAILARLELQTVGYTQKQGIIILVLICLLSYFLGISFFQYSD
jgi:hypothetical protein